jgi:hypothetical protein
MPYIILKRTMVPDHVKTQDEVSGMSVKVQRVVLTFGYWPLAIGQCRPVLPIAK